MNIIFITRCYKPDNILIIKNNLSYVFRNQTKHTYLHYLLVDLSYNQPQQNFKIFEDEHTKIHFTYQKKDYYNNFGIDEVINSIPDDQNTFVYILDDDNLLRDEFIKVFDNYNEEDVLITDWWNSPLVVGHVVGHVDAKHYIVKLKVRKETPTIIEGEKSYSADGVFLERILKKNYSVKYLNISVCIYAALRKPLNVLRRDL